MPIKIPSLFLKLNKLVLFAVIFISSSHLSHSVMLLENYSAAKHHRFANNTSFIGSGHDWSGVARSSAGNWVTMISPTRFISAFHAAPAIGGDVVFHEDNNPNGNTVVRTISSVNQIGNTDLVVGTLYSPVCSTIAHYNLATSQTTEASFTGSAYFNQAAFTVGVNNTGSGTTQFRLGRNALEGFVEDSTINSGTGDAVIFLNDQNSPGSLGDDESQLQPGDSGAPLFITDANGNLVLVGINWFIASLITGQEISAASFVPSYAELIQALLPTTELEAYFTTPVASIASEMVMPTVNSVGMRDIISHLEEHHYRRPNIKEPTPNTPENKKRNLKKWNTFGYLHSYTEDVEGFDITFCSDSLPYVPDYKLNVFGGTAGVDYEIDKSLVIGLGVIGNRASVDMGSSADMKIKGFSFAPYISYYEESALGKNIDFFADFILNFGKYENEVKRNDFLGLSTGRTNMNSKTVNVRSGVNIYQSELIHTLSINANYTTFDQDGYTESGANPLRFAESSHNSFKTRLSYKVAKMINNFRVGGRLAWEHELRSDPETYVGYTLSQPNPNRLILGLSATYFLAEDRLLKFDYELSKSGDVRGHYTNLGLEVKW